MIVTSLFVVPSGHPCSPETRTTAYKSSWNVPLAHTLHELILPCRVRPGMAELRADLLVDLVRAVGMGSSAITDVAHFVIRLGFNQGC